jgi:hypothetical protein
MLLLPLLALIGGYGVNLASNLVTTYEKHTNLFLFFIKVVLNGCEIWPLMLRQEFTDYV